ncbi:MAG: GNAT family N-acetyltransferase [Bacillota bacterium]
MEFIHNNNDISVYNENGETIAIVAFPQNEDGSVTINRTFVGESLRGQGVAGKLMAELAKNLEKTNRKAVPTCSYAVTWFEKHPEHNDLLKK